MREYETLNTLLEKFDNYISRMEESLSDNEPIATIGDAKLFVKIFSSTIDTHPLEKISFMRLENGRIKNMHDSTVLDAGEFTTATFIPKDTCPLPLYAMEASFHFSKYVQCRADLPPLSIDKKYKETFCKPLQELRHNCEELPGLLPMTSLPGLEEFSSGGLLAANIDLNYKETAMKWLRDYADLYLTFLDTRERYPILKEPSIIDEGKQRKTAFRQMFKKMTPRILSDTPEMYSDELAGKLGELLF